ncbi:MAG: hypothetical protein JRE23_17385 [Deltaproteobacteria bacterium]|nr:hypothetical protein [Deltaproteobacteria bacterium]
MASSDDYISTGRDLFSLSRVQTRYIYDRVQTLLVPALKREASERELKRILRGIQSGFDKKFSVDFNDVETQRIVTKLSRRVDREINNQLKKASIPIAMEGRKFLKRVSSVRKDSATSMALKLDGISKKVFDRLTEGIERAAQSGEYGEVLKDFNKSPRTKRTKGQLSTIFQRAGFEGKVLAIDETGTIAAELTKKKMLDNKVLLYKWRTQGDKKVRPTHSNLSNNIYTVDGQPHQVKGKQYRGAIDPAYSSEPIIPREAFNCRCWAIPVNPKDL